MGHFSLAQITRSVAVRYTDPEVRQDALYGRIREAYPNMAETTLTDWVNRAMAYLSSDAYLVG